MNILRAIKLYTFNGGIVWYVNYLNKVVNQKKKKKKKKQKPQT